MRVKELFTFIQERYCIYQRRENGQKRPWTNDKILQAYRFCNVHRENDTVTQWIANNWRTPNANDPDVWFAMTIARLVNNPAALAEINYPVPWKSKKFTRVLHSRKKAGLGIFNAAYRVVSGPAFAGAATADYLNEQVLPALWHARATVRPRVGDRLENFNARLREYRGMGSFIAAQIVADVKFVKPLQAAKDFWTWAAPGPGSRKGLNYVVGNTPETPWRDDVWMERLGILQTLIDPLVKKHGIPRISAQDLQNCLCESF